MIKHIHALVHNFFIRYGIKNQLCNDSNDQMENGKTLIIVNFVKY